MAREFAKPFYNSGRWKRCRVAYIKYRKLSLIHISIPETVEHPAIPETGEHPAIPDTVERPAIPETVEHLSAQEKKVQVMQDA